MIESGEIESELTDTTDQVVDEDLHIPYSEARSKRIRGAFRQGADHLMRQEANGIDSVERDRRMIKLMLALLVLGFVLWFFVFR